MDSGGTMFETLDRVASGSLFWSRLLALNTPPFDPACSTQTGYCFGAGAKHALIISSNDLPGSSLRVSVMLRDIESEDAAVEAELDEDHRFVSGKLWGAPSDEVGVSDLLSGYAVFFVGSEWQLVGIQSVEEGVERD